VILAAATAEVTAATAEVTAATAEVSSFQVANGQFQPFGFHWTPTMSCVSSVTIRSQLFGFHRLGLPS
jgi:capsule polysaccharide export protein KpsE/RkpR